MTTEARPVTIADLDTDTCPSCSGIAGIGHRWLGGRPHFVATCLEPRHGEHGPVQGCGWTGPRVCVWDVPASEHPAGVA